MKRWRLGALGGLVAALSMTLAACGGGAPAAAGSTTSLTLNSYVQFQPNWWFPTDPASACSTGNSEASNMMYLPLLHISKTDTINYGRSLASGITVSQHDTVFTIHMNPKWHWSNGTPVTAEDALVSWQVLVGASQPSSPWVYCASGIGGLPADWKSAVATNRHTLVVTTTKAVNPVWFEMNGLSQIVPVPASVWAHYPAANGQGIDRADMTKELKWISSIGNAPTNAAYRVVDGPYQLSKFVSDQYYTFTANPHYDGYQAHIKSITYQYETSSAGLFAALRRNQLASASLPTSYAADQGQLKGYKRDVASYIYAIDYLDVNMSPKTPGIGSTFKNLYVRQALEMGIPQQQIISALYKGLGVQIHGPVPRTPKNKYYDAAVPAYPFNPAAGKALLQRNGWHENSQGVMTKNGVTLAFTLLYPTGSTTQADIVQLLKRDWSQEGIDVTLKGTPFAQVVGTEGQGAQASKWAMAWSNGWAYEPDYYPTGGGLFRGGAAADSGGYNNSTMNALINATYASGTASQATARMNAYQVFAAKHLPVIWMPEPTGYNEVATWLHGTNTWFNPITTFNYPNHWTISAHS